MVPKRHFIEGQGSGSEVPDWESRQRLAFAGVDESVFDEHALQELASKLEPFIRRVVREEVEHSILPFCYPSARSSRTQIESSGSIAWQLQFESKLPSTIFTGTKIESEDNEPIKIILVDAISKNKITYGPLSSIKIDIVALSGDFVCNDGEEDWSEEEFNANIVHQRDGKKPLITGDLVVTLRDGIGIIGNISFTDNSSWIKCRKFRLGARAQSVFTHEVRIREARTTEAFVVKDHRGESYKKHYPPSLNDDIWRLEKIAKDGPVHRRLLSNGISTVKDFLQLQVTDPSALRNILGSRISNTTLEKIVAHATSCVLDNELYMYYKASERVGVVFNSIFKVVGATFDGLNYQCLDKLNPFQMRLVEDLKLQAYKNLHDLVPIDEPTVNIPLQHQDQLQVQLEPNQRTTSPPYTHEVDIPFPQSPHLLPDFSPNLRNSLSRDFWFEPNSDIYSSTPSVFTDHDDSSIETSLWQGNELFFSSNNQLADGMSIDSGSRFSRNGNPRAGWCKIRAVVKWGISIRRHVAAKRMAWLPSLDL